MRKGNMTILASILAIILVAVGVGAGTMAYFSDTETSTPNVFTAGTIIISISEQTSETSGLEMDNLKPGDEITGTMTVENDGTLPGVLYGRTRYVENQAGKDVAAFDLADRLMVKEFSVDGEVDWTGYMTLAAFCNDYWYEYGTLDAVDGDRSYLTFEMVAEFAEGGATDNDYQGLGVIVSFELALRQIGAPAPPA